MSIKMTHPAIPTQSAPALCSRRMGYSGVRNGTTLLPPTGAELKLPSPWQHQPASRRTSTACRRLAMKCVVVTHLYFLLRQGF